MVHVSLASTLVLLVPGNRTCMQIFEPSKALVPSDRLLVCSGLCKIVCTLWLTLKVQVTALLKKYSLTTKFQQRSLENLAKLRLGIWMKVRCRGDPKLYPTIVFSLIFWSHYIVNNIMRKVINSVFFQQSSCSWYWLYHDIKYKNSLLYCEPY